MASSSSQADSIELVEIVSIHEDDILEITPPLPRKPKSRTKVTMNTDVFSVVSGISKIEDIEEEDKPKRVASDADDEVVEITPPLPRKPRRRTKISINPDVFSVVSEISKIEDIEEEDKPKLVAADVDDAVVEITPPLPRIPKRRTKLSINPDVFTVVSEISKIEDIDEDKLKPVPAPRKFLKNIKQVSVEPRDIFEGGQKSPDTIDTLSGDANSLVSQKSETISYKEKLRSRFLTVKKRAEVSIAEEVKSKVQRRKTILPKDVTFENEERIISSRLSDYESKHERNREAFDFFCAIFTKEQDSNPTPKSKQSSKDDSEEIISADENFSSREVLTDFLDVNLDIDLVELVRPEIVDLAEVEKELFWIPKRKLKQPDDEESDNLEENGIEYNVAHIAKRQLDTLKEKCLKDENINWFTDKNNLKIISDPRLEKTFKPLKLHSANNTLIENYVPLMGKEFLCKDINMYKNTLEMFINSIEFKHHHLFSTEHVLVRRIVELCNEYCKIVQENQVEKCREKLSSLRDTKYSLEKDITSAGSISSEQLQQLRKFREDIKIVREQFLEISLIEKEAKKRLLYYWKTLKQLRSKQEFSSTNLKLLISKQYSRFETEKKYWTNHVMLTVYEILDEKEDDYQTELKDYKVQSKEWKLKFKQLNDNEDSDAIEVLPEKPVKPSRDFSEESIRKEVIKMCEKCLKPPGEPKLQFHLNYGHEVSENVENEREKLRRREFDRTKIFLKIIYNNKEICTTKSISLGSDFEEHVSVKILKIPYTLRVQIFEKTNLVLKRLVCELQLEIPDINTCDNKLKLQQSVFSNESAIKLKHAGVGTGVSLNEMLRSYDLEVEDGDSVLWYSGVVTYGLTWLKENDQTTIEEIISEPVKRETSTPEEDEVCDEEDNRIDRNGAMSELEFGEMEEIENNPRFKLLQLRFRNELEYRDMVVPIRLREISAEIFVPYEKRMKEEDVTLTLNNNEEDIDERRKWAQKFLRQVENKVIQLGKIAEQKLSLRDVLDEEDGPTFGSLGSTFVNLLQPKRPLRPKRKPLKQNPVAVDVKQVQVIVNIVGASQIPIRDDDVPSTSRMEQIFMANVRPFVVVTLGDVLVRTAVAEGPNPIWNQELVLPLKIKSYLQDSFQSLKGSVIINLYDETVEDLVEDDRLRENNIHQRLGCNWLGSLEIPLSTLLSTTKVEGTFQLKLPPILIGYERPSKNSTTESFIQRADTLLTLFATLHPAPKNFNKHLNDDLTSIESENVTEHITEWQNEYNTQFPHRSFGSLVTNISGERCCVTRFVKALKASYVHNEMFEVTEAESARYVSLIPFRENSTIGSDVWLTPEQLLTLTLGSVRDHATLLASYFLGLNIEAWLLLGYGMPQGYTSYVLTKEENDDGTVNCIYDVINATKYNIHDHICPLKKVFCVINNKNVWANIQSDNRIHLTKFDFRVSSDWRPLFSGEMSSPKATLDKINLVLVSDSMALELQEKIEKKIKKKFMSWRRHNRTIWNYYCTAIFKRILVKIEESYPESLSESENLSELENILRSFKIYGFATCFPYTSQKDIVESIRLRGIHLNENSNAEFSLAVHVHPYFNNVVIWIYLASLLKRR